MCMVKVSVMYPRQDGARFDFQYYRINHMELVKKRLTPYGLVKTGVERGVSGGADLPAPYVCIGHLYFEEKEGYDKGMAEWASLLKGDIPNFTDITPIRQISEILDE
jgi:uncharacterized protein (TIGR02118 family)